jgi:hypothetical protein
VGVDDINLPTLDVDRLLRLVARLRFSSGWRFASLVRHARLRYHYFGGTRPVVG